ncbi:MAG: TIGR02285 family protein [Deltaproteobacteria bacterium]|nr:TIGR02285 family protein [Deltaproteobacteria bacterium]
MKEFCKFNPLIFFLVFFLIAFNISEGSSKEKISWLINHWPPIMELDKSHNEITGGQYGEQLLLLQSVLPEYEHLNIDMNWKRFWKGLKKELSICSCMVYKNSEREKIAEFSTPMTVVLPNQIIMRKETIKNLGNPKSLSLIDLIRNKELKGVLIENRSYSKDIDKILQTYEKDSNITRSVISEKSSIKMLTHKRMDFIIEYPFVINHAIKQYLPEYKRVLGSVPIKETSLFFYVYVACPKTEWGKKKIIRINEVLKKIRPDKNFRSKLELMYDKGQMKLISKFYDDYLLNEH